ncbi:hypothetical protein ALI144C_00500 [Actinosynnema sp. ALI-1.44]|uniref:sulfite exporter TauE/SafE family protein n=1 Tax=Actinosynnema sp. ALI-1.44 TaxID=1933779 RepID=UPI00097C59D9|nr:sulfite exporter TauE/SafE family protein [Actinosynnema sp. ALI-1.44]ONI91892.1 hypothetical protein ALI144C_00500 [Actinosynnema sp. ALI-1.44]
MIGVLLLAIPVGLLIGTVGVGGVLLPPALVHLQGLDIHAAAGTSSWCFLFTGVVGTLVYARRHAMPWSLVGRLSLGAAPAATLGALTNGLVPASVVWLLLGAITLGAGAYRLYSRHRSGGDHTQLPTGTAVATGAVVGFGSALTGTGGPVVLVPVLLVLGIAPLTAVAASQVIQLPLVGFAVLGYSTTGSVHYGLGTVLGVLAAVGVFVGGLITSRLESRKLHSIAAVTLVAVGILLLVLPVIPMPGADIERTVP